MEQHTPCGHRLLCDRQAHEACVVLHACCFGLQARQRCLNALLALIAHSARLCSAVAHLLRLPTEGEVAWTRSRIKLSDLMPHAVRPPHEVYHWGWLYQQRQPCSRNRLYTWQNHAPQPEFTSMLPRIPHGLVGAGAAHRWRTCGAPAPDSVLRETATTCASTAAAKWLEMLAGAARWHATPHQLAVSLAPLAALLSKTFGHCSGHGLWPAGDVPEV